MKKLVSEDRLASLVERTGSEWVAIELHQETLLLGSFLFYIIATVEIALRNSVVSNLNGHFGTTGWLRNPPGWFEWKPNEKKRIDEALARARNEALCKGAKSNSEESVADICEGDIVCNLTFHFWQVLYGRGYTDTLWHPTLMKTFPDTKVRRSELASQLDRIRQTRNRLAHHQPVRRGRFDIALGAIDYVAQRLEYAPTIPEPPLSTLLAADLERVRDMHETLCCRLDNRSR